jgi:tRNA(fMet)-specific endonuclease VapC
VEEVGTEICLDTDFLINFIKGKDDEVDFINLHEAKSTLATTQINLFELYLGAYLRKNGVEIQLIDRLSDSLKVLNLTAESSKIAAHDLAHLKMKGKEIDFRDVLIGAITKVSDFSIKTNNKKHFSRIPGIIIEL